MKVKLVLWAFCALAIAIGAADNQTTTNSSEPTTNSSEPTTKSSEPTTNSSEPTTKSSKPTSNSSEPTTKSSEPTSNSSEPTTNSSEPTTHSNEPTTKSSEPTSNSSEPTTKSCESTTKSSEPTTNSSKPTTNSSEPTTNSSELTTNSSKPSEHTTPGPQGSLSTTTEKVYATDQERCSAMIGSYFNDKFEGLEVKYDLEKVLKELGGSPGKVNATWTEKEDAPVDKEDLEKRPLPDADEKYWLYKYGDTDSKTYVRIEHAVRRFSGTPKNFTEIRGDLYFTPDDFCGKARKAHYTVDDRGFSFEVTRLYCWINSVTVSCASPGHCYTHDDGTISCVAAPASALLAALVGGGK